MANPPTAKAITRPMDPSDIAKRVIEISQGDLDTDVLATGQGIASYTLALTAEAVAAGLSIKTGSGYDPQLVGRQVVFYLEVTSGHQADAAFDGSGLSLGIVLTITTTDTPLEKKQVTFVQLVVQR